MTRARHMRWGIAVVRGDSMAPTFSGLRRLVLVDRSARPRVGDVVLAQRPDRPAMTVIKRVTDGDAAGWWLESDAGTRDAVRADSWLFGPVPDALLRGVVVWPRRPQPTLRP